MFYDWSSIEFREFRPSCITWTHDGHWDWSYPGHCGSLWASERWYRQISRSTQLRWYEIGDSILHFLLRKKVHFLNIIVLPCTNGSVATPFTTGGVCKHFPGTHLAGPHTTSTMTTTTRRKIEKRVVSIKVSGGAEKGFRASIQYFDPPRKGKNGQLGARRHKFKRKRIFGKTRNDLQTLVFAAIGDKLFSPGSVSLCEVSKTLFQTEIVTLFQNNCPSTQCKICAKSTTLYEPPYGSPDSESEETESHSLISYREHEAQHALLDDILNACRSGDHDQLRRYFPESADISSLSVADVSSINHLVLGLRHYYWRRLKKDRYKKAWEKRQRLPVWV